MEMASVLGGGDGVVGLGFGNLCGGECLSILAA